MNSADHVPTPPDVTTTPTPTYRDLLDLTNADAARTRPAVAYLRGLATAVPADALVDEVDA